MVYSRLLAAQATGDMSISFNILMALNGGDVRGGKYHKSQDRVCFASWKCVHTKWYRYVDDT